MKLTEKRLKTMSYFSMLQAGNLRYWYITGTKNLNGKKVLQISSSSAKIVFLKIMLAIFCKFCHKKL